jgi:hypothetical protein
VDIDATIVTACSEKDQATLTWKRTSSLHPLTVSADHDSEASGEPLAILLGPGNTGSKTAANHIGAARLAPRAMPRQVLVRTDSGGGTHAFPARSGCLSGSDMGVSQARPAPPVRTMPVTVVTCCHAYQSGSDLGCRRRPKAK